MKGYCIIYFEHRNDVTSMYSQASQRILAFGDYAYDVISMFKINYMIAFHGISVK